MGKAMINSTKSSYLGWAETIKKEGERRCAYFGDSPKIQEEADSIFEAIASELELADTVAQKHPLIELGTAQAVVREITNGINDLRKLGLQDLEELESVKAAAETLCKALLAKEPSPQRH